MFTDNSGANRHAVRTGTKCPHPTSTPLLKGVRPESRAGIFYCYYCFQLGEREREWSICWNWFVQWLARLNLYPETREVSLYGLFLCDYVAMYLFYTLFPYYEYHATCYLHTGSRFFFVKYLNLWLAPRLTDSLIFFLKQWNRNSKLWSLLISFDRKINSSANHYHCLFNSCAVYRAL